MENYNIHNPLKDVKNVWEDGTLSEDESFDSSIGYIRNACEDFGFDDMILQIESAMEACLYIKSQIQSDTDKAEAMEHLAQILNDNLKHIKASSEIIKNEIMDGCNGVFEDLEKGGYSDNEPVDNELNESIKKIKSEFKRFL